MGSLITTDHSLTHSLTHPPLFGLRLKLLPTPLGSLTCEANSEAEPSRAESGYSTVGCVYIDPGHLRPPKFPISFECGRVCVGVGVGVGVGLLAVGR